MEKINLKFLALLSSVFLSSCASWNNTNYTRGYPVGIYRLEGGAFVYDLSEHNNSETIYTVSYKKTYENYLKYFDTKKSKVNFSCVSDSDHYYSFCTLELFLLNSITPEIDCTFKCYMESSNSRETNFGDLKFIGDNPFKNQEKLVLYTNYWFRIEANIFVPDLERSQLFVIQFPLRGVNPVD